MPFKVNSNNFSSHVINSDKPVIVDFYAKWCNHCNKLSGIFEELESEFGDRISFAEADIDELPEIAEKYNIMSIPTLMMFSNGYVTEKSIGFRNKNELVRTFRLTTTDASELA